MHSLIELESHSDTVCLMYIVHAGSIYESDMHRGISHLLEHMLFTNKKHTTERALLTGLLNAGAEFNAYTTFDKTVYFIQGNVTMWSDLIKLFYALVLDEPTFDKKQFDREVLVVLEERNMREDPWFTSIMKLLLGNTKYEHDIAGTESTIKAITPQDLKEYHNRHYGNSHFVCSIPSKIRTDARKLVKDLFGKHVVSCPPPSLLKYDLMKVKASPDTAIVVTQPLSKDDGKTEHLFMLYFASKPYDTSSVAILDFLTFTMTGLSGILYDALRSNKTYTYSIAAENVSFVDAGFFTIGFQSIHPDILEVGEAFFDVMSRLQQSGLTRAEFKQFKSSFLLRETLRLESPLEACSQVGFAAFYDSLFFHNGSKEYIQYVDGVLTYEAVQAMGIELFKCKGAKFIVKTCETRVDVHEKLVAQFQHLLNGSTKQSETANASEDVFQLFV